MSDSIFIAAGGSAPGHPVRWRSENGTPAPNRVLVADDSLTADVAYGHACQGTALLWQGDFQNARQLLAAIAKRAERAATAVRRPKSRDRSVEGTAPGDAFNRYRQGRAQRARTLGRLLVPLDAEYRIPLRRAPDVRQACCEAYGPPEGPSITSLRELLGVIGAHEWRRRGIAIDAVGGRIHPHYGVFAPIRHEYVSLVADTALPSGIDAQFGGVAFDIGTGTGVLAAVLARRGYRSVIATDHDPRAIACARANLERLGFADRVELLETDLFPPGRAGLIVCNPPWVPARPTSRLETGIYDAESRMLRGFLAALPARLAPRGEGWLLLSDLAEHLGLRSRSELLAQFSAAGLRVLARHDAIPRHPRVSAGQDPLHAARAAERTTLWRLGVESAPAGPTAQ